MSPRARGVLWLTLACVLWGTTGTAASFARDALGPLAIGAAAMGVGGVLLFASSPRGAVALLRDQGHRPAVLLGAAAVAVYPLAFYTSMALAGVALGTMLSLGAAPLAAALMEHLLYGSRIPRSAGLAFAVSAMGMVMLSLFGAHAPGGGTDALAGVLFGLLAAASYAGYTVAARHVMGSHRLSSEHEPRAVMGALFGLAAVPLLLAFAALTAGSGAAVLAVPAGPVLGYLGLVMFFSYLLFGAGLRTVDATTATLVTMLEPVIAAVLAVSVAHQPLAPAGWAGIALILAGVYGAARAGR